MQKFSEWVKQRSSAAGGMAGMLPTVLRALLDPYTGHSGAGKTAVRLKTQSEAISLLCLLLVILLAVFDLTFASRFSFTLFYLLIVAAAAWSGGRRNGIFIAVISLGALIAHEVRTTEGRFAGAQYWNLVMQFAIYLFVAYLVSYLRNLTDTLERRVRERTLALEHEISDRIQTEEQLRKTMQQFRQMAENISDAFWMRDAKEARMTYVSPAYEMIWARSCRELYQFPQRWLEAIHPEDRDRVAEAMYTRQTTGEYSQEYRIVRPDGSLRWVRDRAFPIRDTSGKVVRVVGIAEDITERRRLEREILEISDREQARMGQDLHDGLCQKLISIAFHNNSLEQKLESRREPEAKAVREIGDVLDDVITEARALARGLFPVQLETNGLSLALEQLAASVTARSKVNCLFECPAAVSILDNAAATHLYRIAQEAVNNALKHAKAKTILIQLTTYNDMMELSVSDDGIGIASDKQGTGMGLHIMKYRARTIGGVLTINPGANGGTVVACSIRQTP